MFCTIREASELLGYKSTSTMYRLYQDGALDPYVSLYMGKPLLDMRSHGKRPTLARHVMTLVNWQADFQVNDFDPDEYIKQEAQRIKAQEKVNQVNAKKK